MTLLEREAQLAALHDHLCRVETGRGRLVFLGGEAGSGKSTLVEAFSGSVRGTAPVSLVSCDGCALPGPFGGLADFVAVLGSGIDALLAAQAPREQIFRAVFEALQSAPVHNVLIGEDAHWTDEASLDLLRYIGRRIGQTRTLFIVTYRDDALDLYHPLRRVLGDLVNEPSVARLSVPPLSLAAVRHLAAGSGIDPVALHERTGGNPFYVTEIIGGGDEAIPATIRDAVLARASRLSPEGRALLDAAAVIGIQIDPDLLEQVAGAPVDAEIDEALAAGMVRAIDDGIAFRHALARDVLYEAMSPSRRRGLHRRVLATLEADPFPATEHAQLAHHAEGARDREAVLRHGPAAAREAARFGAHREAAAQLARTLRYAHGLPPAELAELLEARSYECYLTGQIDDAIADSVCAAELRRRAGDGIKVGDNLRWLSRFHWFAGNTQEAVTRAREALELLETLPPGAELAMAYSNLSQLRMLANDEPEAIRWGERAIELATEFDNQPILAHALTNVGSARCFSDLDEGRRLIEQAVQIARAGELHDDVARALTNLGWASLEHYDLANAERYIAEGIEFTVERDILGMELYLRGLSSRALLGRGAWDAAEREASAVLKRYGTIAASRVVANTVLGQVRARRGEDAADVLDEALRWAEQTGELQRLGPVRAARAEAAWLAGDPELAAAEAEHEWRYARCSEECWLTGNLALWMHRGGRTIDDLTGLAEPFALEIAGRGAEAAAIWRERGYPLEEARALASTGEEEQLRAAHAIFDRLGAKPDLARTVRALRDAGVTQIPRGPRPETRANSAGLTARELDVVQLLTEGRTNREIADALFLSHRTVGHHVSAILAKLDVSARGDVRARAEALDLVRDRSLAAPK